ncbi:hypothetical protein SPD48_07920 [Pseudogracilibacillus sp. SE30717A]|uniref:hypothetical protein n=1 Tax=Pseudogracilibacillus sp. SE30717A TaxID=3098293 RepID=UPI00300DF345
MIKENNGVNNTSYFNLPEEERLELELEKKDKEEKRKTAEKVIKKVKDKFTQE